jgi:oxygen-independent coproporphyrinogen-3 oxidase
MKPIETLKAIAKPNKHSLRILEHICSILSGINELDANCKYEYFYQKRNKNLKLLHLLFYKQELEIKRKREIYLDRKKQLVTIFKFLNSRHNFNFTIFKKIFTHIDDPEYPIQIAFEFCETIEKIKIYFSNASRIEGNRGIICIANELSRLLCIEDRLDASILLGEGIDSIGIDFLSNGTVNLKLYTFFHSKFGVDKIRVSISDQFRKHNVRRFQLKPLLDRICKLDYSEWGFLYRFSDTGTVNSAKFWYRIAHSEDLRMNLNDKHHLKVSYITCDQDGLGFYLREDEEMLQNQDYLFKEITEKIAEKDFTGYTIQYPPLDTWKQINRRLIYGWNDIALNDYLGLYIHIPFCKEKCSFCRYFSEKLSKQENIDKFIYFLKTEFSLYSHYFKNKKFRTLYIGGGTPTILNELQLKELFESINQNFKFANNNQMCIEATLNTLNPDKLAIMKDFGINRLTVGIQTLTPGVLQAVNREQPEAKRQLREIILQSRKAGIKSINIDIMSGLPGETIKTFEKVINYVVGLSPDMIHVHPFYPTAYTNFMKNGNRLSRKDMNLRNEMSILAKDIIISKGYKNIKFDAFGMNEDSRNIQLSDAIEHIGSYIGFGPGATSHLKNRFRYVNYDNKDKYFLYLLNKKLPIMKGIELNAKDEMIYYVTACLRYGEVSKKSFYKIFRKHITSVFNNEISYLKQRKLITEEEDIIIFRSNNIGEYLVYSKYFYSKSMINLCYKNVHTIDDVMSEKDIKYILL